MDQRKPRESKGVIRNPCRQPAACCRCACALTRTTHSLSGSVGIAWHLRDALGNLVTQPLRGLYLLCGLALVVYRLVLKASRRVGDVTTTSSGTAAMVMWQRSRGAALGFGPDSLAHVFAPVNWKNDAPWVFERFMSHIQAGRYHVAQRLMMEEDFAWLLRLVLRGVPEAATAYRGDLGIGFHQCRTCWCAAPRGIRNATPPQVGKSLGERAARSRSDAARRHAAPLSAPPARTGSTLCSRTASHRSSW
jgi:hypothetical protein